jgi:delta14-sterol reductase
VDLSPAGAAAARAAVSEFRARTALQHFYCGVSEFNPRVMGVDVKMWLYVVGAVQLELNVACAALYVVGSGHLVVAPLVVLSCLSFFVVEYLYNEDVHLYTYDIFRERLGFKLLWGCLCFYPWAYALPIVPLVLATASGDAVPGATSDLSPLAAACIVALFAGGWVCTRGANYQKYCAKVGRQTCLGSRLVFVPGSDGRLVCSGFWAVSRHVNYLGEMVQALALALPAVLCTGSGLSLLYPLYYVLLFVPRERDDEAMCRQKYGSVWAAYVDRVPYRIVPYVY